jgi:hypothetical protein
MSKAGCGFWLDIFLGRSGFVGFCAEGGGGGGGGGGGKGG